MIAEYMWRGVVKVRKESGEVTELADRPMLSKGAATLAAKRAALSIQNSEKLTLIHYRVDRTVLAWEEFETHPVND